MIPKYYIDLIILKSYILIPHLSTGIFLSEINLLSMSKVPDNSIQRNKYTCTSLLIPYK